MKENNFKKLEEEMENKFSGASEIVKKNINTQRNFWTLIGDLIELYIPKILNTIIGTSGSLGQGLKKRNRLEEGKSENP